MLFYENAEQNRNDTVTNMFLEKLLGYTAETFNIFEHRNAYDHEHIPEYFPGTDTKMPSTCWCEIPDSANTQWPKLHIQNKNNDYIASGNDILLLTINDIQRYTL